MPEVVLGVGSNVRPEAAFRAARAALEAQFATVRWSSVFRSAAQGVVAADYWNAAASFVTELPLAELRARLRAIEESCGRRRGDTAVTELDLDVLFYGACVDAQQRVPRPGAFTEPFVVAPLAELAPALVHPVLGTTADSAARRLAPGVVVRLGPLDAIA